MSLRPTLPKRISIAFSTLTLALTLLSSPVFAKDPFRTTNSRNIGDRTEAAFDAIFKYGNYPQAKIYLAEAELNETGDPLLYAMRASLAYTEQDWNTLNTYAAKTLSTAQRLTTEDPLRGNLYTAVGYFLEGTYNFKQEGPIRALTQLQKVFEHLDKAEQIDPNDPELNLLKGYMELILAVNLPFSSAELAIERLQQNATPTYLVHRGIAIAYRDLDKYNEALKFVEQALQATPDNPELYYLKGQILYKQGKENKNSALLRQAVQQFDLALAKNNQLPESVVRSLQRERRIAQTLLDGKGS